MAFTFKTILYEFGGKVNLSTGEKRCIKYRNNISEIADGIQRKPIIIPTKQKMLQICNAFIGNNSIFSFAGVFDIILTRI